MSPPCTATPNKRNEADSGRDAEMRAGQRQGQDAADQRKRDGDEDQQRIAHGIQHEIDEKQE